LLTRKAQAISTQASARFRWVSCSIGKLNHAGDCQTQLRARLADARYAGAIPGVGCHSAQVLLWVNLRLTGFPLHMPARRPKADIPQAPRAFFRAELEKVVAGACNHRELTLPPITI
jgi:hypothetical protein